MAGLGASAGALVLLNQVTPISVWELNFALMFALGIDDACSSFTSITAASTTDAPV